MKTLMTTTALVALLSVPVFAQGDADPLAVDPPAATEPAPLDAFEAPTDDPAAVDDPAQDAFDADTLAPDQAVEAPLDEEAPAVADTPLFIDRQDQGQELASDWMGQTIYDRDGNSLGDIKDMVLNDDGSVHAVIIGVGGFLGIGEKRVAISFDALQTSTDENGNVRVYLEVSAEQLETAPDFMTLADIEAEERARQMELEAPIAPSPM